MKTKETVKNLIKFMVFNIYYNLKFNNRFWFTYYFKIKYRLSIFTYLGNIPYEYNYYSTHLSFIYNRELIKIDILSSLIKNKVIDLKNKNNINDYYIFSLNEEKLTPLDLYKIQTLTFKNIFNKKLRKDIMYLVSLNNISSLIDEFFTNIKDFYSHNKEINYKDVFDIIDNLFPTVDEILNSFNDIKFGVTTLFSSNIYDYHKATIETFINFIKTLNQLQFNSFFYDIAYNFKNQLLQKENNLFKLLIDQINENTFKNIYMQNIFYQVTESEYFEKLVYDIINELQLTNYFENTTYNYFTFKDKKSINIKDFILSILILNNLLKL